LGIHAGPEKAARRILEIANAVEPIQGRIHIEQINEPLLNGRATIATVSAASISRRKQPRSYPSERTVASFGR
jgi:hypothetical protein